MKQIPFNSDNYNMFVAMPNVHGQYGTDTKHTSPHEISSPFLNEFKHILNLMREYSKKCIKHMILDHGR